MCRHDHEYTDLVVIWGNMSIEKIFDTGMIKINYAEGAPNGAPLVALRGATRPWQDLSLLINELEKDWHIFACDQRRHGKSDWGDLYSILEMTSDVTSFAKEIVDEPTKLIGHSGGTFISLVVASQIPELVKSLIVIDPPLFYMKKVRNLVTCIITL